LPALLSLGIARPVSAGPRGGFVIWSGGVMGGESALGRLFPTELFPAWLFPAWLSAGGFGAGGFSVGGVLVGGAAHVCFSMVFISSVTAPSRASNRPSMVAPVVAVMLVSARMFPRKVKAVPTRVAELPTCQKTLHAWAPLISTTWLLGAVTSVDSVWKMKTAPVSFSPSRVRVPVIPKSPPPGRTLLT